MKQHIELVAKVAGSIEERHVGEGWQYIFDLVFSDVSNDQGSQSMLIPCLIHQRFRRPDLLGARAVHVIGKMEILGAWCGTPTRLRFRGHRIEPVSGRFRKVAREIFAPEESGPSPPGETGRDGTRWGNALKDQRN